MYFENLDKNHNNAFTMESGRYFEHIGVVEFDLDKNQTGFLNFNHSFVETSVSVRKLTKTKWI